MSFNNVYENTGEVYLVVANCNRALIQVGGEVLSHAQGWFHTVTLH